MSQSELKWVSVNDYLPKAGNYLVFRPASGKQVIFDCIDLQRYLPAGGSKFSEDVTHWMELPPFPKQEEL